MHCDRQKLNNGYYSRQMLLKDFGNSFRDVARQRFKVRIAK